MITTGHVSARIIASLLEQYEVKEVVASPGSRNAPLIVAVSRHPGLNVHTVVDERCAAFVALGMSVRKNHPVALICTSGTALLNYAPAIAEAYYRHAPLIVISADRPARWIDQDDGQTIRQPGALANIVKGTFDICVDNKTDDYPSMVNRIVNNALQRALSRPSGPVHINVQLVTPLGLTSETANLTEEAHKIEVISAPDILPHSEALKLCEGLEKLKIGIIVGFSESNGKLSKALKRLSIHPNIVIFNEPQSNIKGIVEIVGSPEGVITTLNEEERINHVPDIIITIGGSVVSRNLKELLRTADIAFGQWYVGYTYDDSLIDCYGKLEKHIKADAPSFLNTLASYLKRAEIKETDFSKFWRIKTRQFHSKTKSFASKCEWGDFEAIYTLMKELDENVNLQISNGMAIRYAQFFEYNKFHRIDCNRGCSGIDGSTSTAIGAAIGCPIPTVLISGDMSANYDIGALAIEEIPENFTLIVINNGGGDIFRIIDSTKNFEETEDRIALRNKRHFLSIAKAYGFNYYYACMKWDLEDILHTPGLLKYGPNLIEIDTSRCDNPQIYYEYLNYLKDN